MYLCWDSTRESTTNKIGESLEISKEGEIANQDAKDLALISQSWLISEKTCNLHVPSALNPYIGQVEPELVDACSLQDSCPMGQSQASPC